MTGEMPCRKRRLSSFQIIILGFAGVILLGALLLMLPLSTTAGCVTPFHEALFTATSAVCVTGLVVQDTGSYWSGFGQAVILTLIQIGGLGVVTVAAAVRAKDLSDAAQHHAGRHFSAKGRRNRPADPVHPAGNISDRTGRRTRHAAGVLPGLRMARDLDGGVSFRLRLLQRRV